MGSKEILVVAAVVLAMIASRASGARLLAADDRVLSRQESAGGEPALHLAFRRESSSSSGDGKTEDEFLLLSSLPRGRVPPSGPSRRTNNLIG